MSAMKIVSILVLLISSSFAVSETINKRGYCGRMLSEFLDEVCQEHGMTAKRTSDAMMVQRGEVDGWMETQRALDFGRTKRGIVDECCYKTCTVKTLLSYCAG